MYYRLSKNYRILFALISAGEIIAAFVDYELIEDEMLRDLCKVQRHGPYQIRIGVRGMQYGGLERFNEEDGDEKELFIAQCKALNLEWVCI